MFGRALEKEGQRPRNFLPRPNKLLQVSFRDVLLLVHLSAVTQIRSKNLLLGNPDRCLVIMRSRPESDVPSYQPLNVNRTAVESSGFKFAVIKATEALRIPLSHPVSEGLSRIQ